MMSQPDPRICWSSHHITHPSVPSAAQSLLLIFWQQVSRCRGSIISLLDSIYDTCTSVVWFLLTCLENLRVGTELCNVILGPVSSVAIRDLCFPLLKRRLSHSPLTECHRNAYSHLHNWATCDRRKHDPLPGLCFTITCLKLHCIAHQQSFFVAKLLLSSIVIDKMRHVQSERQNSEYQLWVSHTSYSLCLRSVRCRTALVHTISAILVVARSLSLVLRQAGKE